MKNEQMAIIKSKLAPGAQIEFWSCNTAAGFANGLQNLATKTGATVMATDGCCYTPLGGFSESDQEPLFQGTTSTQWFFFRPGGQIPQGIGQPPPAKLK